MKQTNERLCALAQKGDATALDGLIDNNKSFIGKVANDLFHSMNLAQSGLNLDTDDLKQAGNLGLWKAVPKFDAARFLLLHNDLRLHGVGVGYGFNAPQLLFSRQNIVQRNTLVTDTILVLRYHPLFKSSKGIPNHIHHGVADGRSCVGQELHAARCTERRCNCTGRPDRQQQVFYWQGGK